MSRFVVIKQWAYEFVFSTSVEFSDRVLVLNRAVTESVYLLVTVSHIEGFP